jgi:electron transfer flavoprotein beta subunit
MNTIVIMKMVPDTVEELEVDDSNKRLDEEYLRLIPAEQDEHALEQALLIKEKLGGEVTVITLDLPGCDDVLFSALAKGATKAIKVTHSFEHVDTGLLSKIYSSLLPNIPHDMVFAGCQAIDDLDGEVGALLASKLNMPYVGVAIKVQPDASSKSAEVVKELGGGLNASFESPLPMIVGISSAEKPPRYVPLMKVRKVMKSMKLETMDAPEVTPDEKVDIMQLKKPEVAGKAEMLSGSPEELAGRLMKIFSEKGLV